MLNYKTRVLNELEFYFKSRSMKILLISVILSMSLSFNFLNAQKRVFKEVSLDFDKKIKLSDFEIFRPNLLSTNSSGDLVFFDYIRFQIVSYNSSDSGFKFIGEGKGRGPKEFNMIMDLKIDEKGIITLADRDKNKIVRWNIEGRYIGEYKTNEKFIQPSRVAICGNSDSVYILSSQYSPNGIIHYLSLNNEFSTKSFLKIDSPDKRLPYYTDGELDCDEDHNFYYANRYVNSIKKYDSNSNIIFDIPVYGFEKNEKIMENKGRMFTPAEGVRRASGDIYKLENNLFVGFSDHKYSKLKLIDIYDPISGEYKFSIDVPFLFKEFAISDRNIFFINEESNGEIFLQIYNFDKKRL